MGLRVGDSDSANTDGGVIAIPLGPCNLADLVGLEVSVVGKDILQSLWQVPVGKSQCRSWDLEQGLALRD